MGQSYKDAGVDVELGDAFVRRIRGFIGETYNDRVVSGVGGFAALYDMGDGRYLASGTDGVGTKLMLAQQLGVHHSIGQDLVAMCANDLICTGARPLFFLDYLATGKLQLDIHEAIVKGIASACMESGMALVGGETAEMPGMYPEGKYDLAGFAVGEVKKDDLINGETIKAGDQIVGIASSGFHSNGYSLIRTLIDPEETDLLHQALVPTRLYVRTVLKLVKKFGSSVKGLAHITGGGLDNISRIHNQLGFRVDLMPGKDEVPGIISTLAERSKLPSPQLYRTWNMGVGFVVVCDNCDELITFLQQEGESCWQIGEVTDEASGLLLNIK